MALLVLVLIVIVSVYYIFFKERDDGLDNVDVGDEVEGIESVTPEIEPAPIEPTPIEPTYYVVIDPGHGGKDGGAIGASGKLEKDFTLRLSLLVKDLLEQEDEIGVHMTRSDDTFISSIDRERAQIANELEADLFISIHGNTFTDPSVSGTETYYYDDESYLFAEVMHVAVVVATGFRDRGIKYEDYFVLKETHMPAALIEVGYLTNEQEEQIMWKDDFQKEVATAIVSGIKKYLKMNGDQADSANEIEDGEDELIAPVQ